MTSFKLAEMMKMARQEPIFPGSVSSPALDMEPSSVNLSQAEQVDNLVVPKVAQKDASKGPAKRKESPAPVDPSSKKSKPSKSSSKHEKTSKSDPKEKQKSGGSFPLDADFLAQAIKDFAQDPVEVSARVFQNLKEVHRKGIDAIKRKATVAEERAKKDAVITSLKASLEKTKSELKETEQERSEMVKDRDAALKKVHNLEAEAANANALRLRNEELSKADSSSRQKIADMEARLKEVEEKLVDADAEVVKEKDLRVKAAQYAIDLYDEGFEEALTQLVMVYPKHPLDRDIVNKKHSADLLKGQIIHVDRDTQEKTLVWEREADA